MTAATITFLGLGLASYLFKSAGPLLLGGRPLPASVTRLSGLVPGPLLGALVLTSVAVSGGSFSIDARLVGLVAAAVALRFRANFVVVVLAASAATALARLIA